MANEHQSLSVADLISILPLGRSSIYKLINTPDFPKIRIGRRVVIPKEHLRTWLKNNLGHEIKLDD